VPYNQTILNSPIILFLGAGASAPLSKPMMQHFLNRVASQLRDLETSKLLEDLKRFRGNDLEAVLGELDTLIGLDYAQSVSVASQSGGYYQSLDRETALRLRTSLKHQIIREYRNVDSAETVKVYSSFLNTSSAAWTLKHNA
jgi:hypothetical protein